jgi:hypothetical protein
VAAVEIVTSFVSGAHGRIEERVRQGAGISCRRHPHRAVTAPVYPIVLSGCQLAERSRGARMLSRLSSLWMRSSWPICRSRSAMESYRPYSAA